uniref:CUB domain-containing protein n=1 Tax=Heterorhabditis bacteriophora TaxID=37862 RepID=A0A1I7XM02_HETBA
MLYYYEETRSRKALSAMRVVLLFLLMSQCYAENKSFSDPTGIIYSPNYPDDYDNQLNVYYTISVAPGYYIHFTLLDFITEACCDKLYIWNGNDLSQPTIANISGDSTGLTFDSSGHIVTMLFNTDFTGTYKGFAIRYESLPSDVPYQLSNACASVLHTSALGFITSPNWPANYPNNISCNYLIAVPEGRVKLTFVAFNTEACCDKVEIYDGSNATYHKFAELSGDSLVNMTFYSSQSNMFLTFYSDYTLNEKGFSAFYMMVN